MTQMRLDRDTDLTRWHQKDKDPLSVYKNKLKKPGEKGRSR